MPLVRVTTGQPSAFGTRVDAEGWPLLDATRLTIHRTFSDDEGSRQIICALNGERIGQLLFGQRLSIEIPPGDHLLRVHNTLVWKNVAFDALPGSHTHVTVWNRSWAGYYTYMMFFGPAPLFLGVGLGAPDRIVVPPKRGLFSRLVPRRHH